MQDFQNDQAQLMYWGENKTIYQGFLKSLKYR